MKRAGSKSRSCSETVRSSKAVLALTGLGRALQQDCRREIQISAREATRPHALHKNHDDWSSVTAGNSLRFCGASSLRRSGNLHMRAFLSLLFCTAALGSGLADESPVALLPPGVLGRSEWGAAAADLEILAASPMGKVRFLSIHHSESPTPDSIDEVERVKRIQHGHMVADHQWGDIAYHYLIGPSGRIYEGRSTAYAASSGTVYLRPADWLSAGQNELGMTSARLPENVSGEKAAPPGASEGHLTICFLGNFEAQLPSPPARASMARLVAHLLKAHGLSVHEIMFHREIACWTDCPGQALYDWFRGPTRKRTAVGDGLRSIATGIEK